MIVLDEAHLCRILKSYADYHTLIASQVFRIIERVLDRARQATVMLGRPENDTVSLAQFRRDPIGASAPEIFSMTSVCTENLIRIYQVTESAKLANRPEPRLPDTRITAIRMTVERITESISP